MGTGRLGGLLKSRSAGEVSGDAGFVRPKAVLILHSKSKGKSPMVSTEPAPSSQKPSLNIDTRPLNTVGTRQSYGAIERQSIGGLSLLKCDEPETDWSGHVLFDVPEEVDDQDLEALLEEEGLYLGSLHPSHSLVGPTNMAQGLTNTLSGSTPSYPSHHSSSGSSLP